MSNTTGESPDSMLLTDMEAARQMRLSRAKVWRLMQSGDLAYIKIGRSRRVTREALEDFVARLVHEAGVDAVRRTTTDRPAS